MKMNQERDVAYVDGGLGGCQKSKAGGREIGIRV